MNNSRLQRGDAASLQHPHLQVLGIRSRDGHAEALDKALCENYATSNGDIKNYKTIRTILL